MKRRYRAASLWPATLLTSLALLLASASAGPVAARTTGAAGATTASAQVLMPFDGAWANDFSTAPWQHSRTSAEDWTMDLFAAGTDVYARIGNVTGEVRIEVAPPEAYGCAGAGSMVWVTVFVDDFSVGRFGYHHLADVEYPAGTSVTDSTEVRLGRTVSSPFSFGGGCWHVSTAAGIHAHLVLDNASGYSCYAPYDKGQSLSSTDVIAVLGGQDGVSWGSAPRSQCDATALQAGGPPPEPGPASDPAPASGYWMLERSGAVHGFGDAS
ncbi:MAG: hypothetical protein P8N02_11685, partial [Actinomycetota bacterium]|nr:hypothetical protein [Actinomycetota bacterium]